MLVSSDHFPFVIFHLVISSGLVGCDVTEEQRTMEE